MRDTLLAIVFAALIGVCPSPAVAQPQNPAAPAATTPGAIRGRITAADTGRSLRRARVSLVPTSAPVSRPSIMASTNAQGHFELKGVAAGSYFVSASRAGHLQLQYGQRRPRERGLAVEVHNGQIVERIDIALPRAGILAGRITDELGEPYPGVRVMALEIRYELGRRVPFPVGNATTDDLGQYRMPGLGPGSYLVSGLSQETWRNEKKETLGYAAIYFPGVAVDMAQPVSLGVSQERVDMDFALTASRTARVSGRVQRPTGEPMPGEPVSLALTVRGGGFVLANSPISTRTAPDGSFEIRDVAPGDYIVRSGSRGESASMALTVANDIENLILVPRGGSTVTGSVVTDEGTPPPFPASGVRLFLIAPEPDKVLPTVRVPAVNNDWSFTLTSLGGPFVFRLQGLPDDWMLDAVRLNDRDITDVPYDVPTGGRDIAGLEVVLTQKVGKIEGNVVNADGKPTVDATVIIFSDDSALWMPGSRFVRSTRPDSSGVFSVAALPAGTYLAVAKDVVIDGQWENKEFLESVRKDAVRVTLSQGGSESVALKMPPPR